MWIAVLRSPPRDVAYWPGRRLAASVDAIGWPALWVMAVAVYPGQTGLSGPVIQTLAIILAVRRTYQAVCRNERYRFTTWRWGVPVTFLLALGAATKLLA
jgi:hypothetical protein